MVYLQLFIEFFKTGLLAVGGGLATLPFLKEIAQTHSWFTINQLTDMIAISESTPGPIGVNMATYAGFHAAGVSGAVTATLSLILPSYIVILIVARFMEKFRNSPLVNNVFYGIRPATAGLIAGAMFEVFVLSLFDTQAYAASGSLADLFRLVPIVVYVAALIGVFRLPKVHPILFIICGAVLGIALGL
ncbi:MAG TPA: chromate transporter [Candidatus Butyricicoccus stercorigallinarum]|nr:chromate transporter [Candidatus Butyricicoccus stercorigallinarum]